MAAYPRAVGRFAEAALEEAAPPPSPPSPYPVAPHRTAVSLWLPLTPLFLLLAPFAILLSPLGFLAPRRWRPGNPFLGVLALGSVLLSLSGTDILVDTPDAHVRLKIL